ncbi:MAG: hypothetical protein AABX83_01850 [Nanoarchaeota archaeon]
MANLNQARLKLGMDALGIPVKEKFYREICNAAYLAQEEGIYISHFKLYLSEKGAFAPKRKIHYDIYSSLFHDVREIENDPESDQIESEWKLDNSSLEKLRALKDKIKKQGLEALIKSKLKTE